MKFDYSAWDLFVPILSIATIAVVGIVQPRFLSVDNLTNVLYQTTPLAIFSMAQMVPILSRGLDLSQGGIIVGTSVAFALLAQPFGTIPASLIALLLGAGAGLTNGLIIGSLGVSPFVVTLGVGSILQGLALVAANGQPISTVPADFANIYYDKLFSVPIPLIVTTIVAGALAFLLSRVRIGRFIFAVGSNERAALLSGIPVRTTLICSYVLCGITTSVGAVLLSSRIASGHPTVGSDTALQAVAACVIGGVSLFGGKGTVIGALGGAVFLGLLSNALNLLNVSSFLQLVAIGVAVIVAVVADRFRLSALEL